MTILLSVYLLGVLVLGACYFGKRREKIVDEVLSELGQPLMPEDSFNLICFAIMFLWPIVIPWALPGACRSAYRKHLERKGK